MLVQFPSPASTAPASPGRCFGCPTNVWRRLDNPRTRTTELLWPDPDAVFGVVAWANGDGVAPGIAFHAPCAPAVGSLAPGAVRAQAPTATVIVGYETAATRYAAWFAPERETFLRLLAGDLGVNPDGLIEAWNRDRARLASAVEAK